MPTIEANGRATAYEVDGAGPPLVLLHGATGSGGDHFAGLRPVLAKAFKCYMPDARGHGGTAWDAGESWTTADLVADLDAFVDAVGLETFHLLGYSLGGITALHYAARLPERLRTLVAISIATEREPRLPVGRVLDGSGLDRARGPGMGGTPDETARPGPRPGRLAAPPRCGRRGYRDPAASDPSSTAGHRRTDPGGRR